MPVYVDPLFDHGKKDAPKCFRKQPSAHMYADSLSELHAMARRLGLKRKWFQDHATLKHYDLTETRRRQAVTAGVIEHTSEQLKDFIRQRRLQNGLD